MPAGSSTIEIAASATRVFDLLHNYTRRLEWDPFLQEAALLHDATSAGIGVQSRCRARLRSGGASMQTEYVTFHRPTVAAVRMIQGPCFLSTFAAAIRHEVTGKSSSRLTYRYNFTCPRGLATFCEPVIGWVFRQETRSRLRALKRFMEARLDLETAASLREA